MQYDLRLLGEAGETLRIYRLHCPSDERAKEAILSIREDYARYELWRGMECLARGGRFIVADLPQADTISHGSLT